MVVLNLAEFIFLAFLGIHVYICGLHTVQRECMCVLTVMRVKHSCFLEVQRKCRARKYELHSTCPHIYTCIYLIYISYKTLQTATKIHTPPPNHVINQHNHIHLENSITSDTAKININLLTLKVLVATIDAQWEGMGNVGSARYELALLPPCPTIRVLSYSN